MVEGPNDVNFFDNIFTAVSGIDPTVLDISSSPHVAIVPMGGADLKHWVTRQYLQGFGCVEYHVYGIRPANYTEMCCGAAGKPDLRTRCSEIWG